MEFYCSFVDRILYKESILLIARNESTLIVKSREKATDLVNDKNGGNDNPEGAENFLLNSVKGIAEQEGESALSGLAQDIDLPSLNGPEKEGLSFVGGILEGGAKGLLSGGGVKGLESGLEGAAEKEGLQLLGGAAQKLGLPSLNGPEKEGLSLVGGILEGGAKGLLSGGGVKGLESGLEGAAEKEGLQLLGGAAQKLGLPKLNGPEEEGLKLVGGILEGGVKGLLSGGGVKGLESGLEGAAEKEGLQLLEGGAASLLKSQGLKGVFGGIKGMFGKGSKGSIEKEGTQVQTGVDSSGVTQKLDQSNFEEAAEQVGVQLAEGAIIGVGNALLASKKVSKKSSKISEEFIHSEKYKSINPESTDCFASKIIIHYPLEWKFEEAILENQILLIGEKIVKISEVNKLKCLSEEAKQDDFCKLKITKNNAESIYFATEIEQFKLGFPVHYAWFSKIICNKLSLMGHDLAKPYVPDNTLFEVNKTNYFCKGVLFKRSQHKKIWEARYIVINSEGLFSYKNSGENYTFAFTANSAKYIWTRFEMHNNNLIVKVKHGMDQTEFAIPITNYCRKSGHNWLYAFYRMVMGKNITAVMD